MIATEVKGESLEFHPVIRFIARVISVVFHPLFVPVYMGWFFIYELHLFSQISDFDRTKLLISFAVNYTILPLVTLLLAKALGFVESIYLKTRKDRIIPYVATGVFYFWIWYVFKNQGYPKEVVMFSLAVFLASSFGLVLNSFIKISMHALSAGVALTLLFLLSFYYGENLGYYITIGLIAAGLVCTARLVNDDHEPKEVYAGLAVGIAAQLIAILFV